MTRGRTQWTKTTSKPVRPATINTPLWRSFCYECFQSWLRMLSELFQLVSDISDLLHIKTLGFFLLPPDNIPLNLQHAEARVSCHEELRTLQILPRICKTLADLISIFRFGLLWQLRESETHCRSVFLEDSVRFA